LRRQIESLAKTKTKYKKYGKHTPEGYKKVQAAKMSRL
jgi:hypothetical protein